MRPLFRLTRRCAVGGAIVGLIAGLVISQPASAASTPADPSAAALGNAQKQVQSAAQQLASAEAEVRTATDQLQQISYEVVKLHDEQAQAQVALDAARADTRTAVRAAYENASVDPTVTLFADLSGKDPGLADQVRANRLADVAERTGTLAAASEKLAGISKQASARSVEAVKAAARAVSASQIARDGLAAAQKTSTELQKAAELAAQRKELERLNQELQTSLANVASRAAGAGSSGIGVTASAPADIIALYQGAAKTCPGLPWGVLAGIGQVETNHGQNKNISSAGAMGPMQFMPATFAVYGVDGDGDGIKDILDQADAVFSAAHYLCSNGGGDPSRLYDAIYDYNHLDSYVQEVLSLAAQYQAGKQPT